MRRPARFTPPALAALIAAALALDGGRALAQNAAAAKAPVPRAAARPVTGTATTAAPVATAGTAATGKRGNFSADDIDAASYDGGDLPAGQSALTAKVQILLDRAGTSPGVIDGFRGGMSESALKAFERRHALPMDGRMDSQIWELLQPYAGDAMTTSYTITEADAQGLVERIPTDYAEKAAMSHMGYTSITEKLAERFHMDEKFIAQLNPGVTFAPGATIRIVVPAKPIRTRVDRIFVDKQTGRVAAYAGDRMVVDYPATVGSSATPSPHGTVTVTRVAMNPDYTYNPNINFKQGQNDRILKVPPGPNGPVGTVWIALSKPTYGVHGTPTPSRLFVQESHGCVRLTNWDAEELAHMVQPGVTVVEFLTPGVTIAQAVGLTPEAATGETATAANGTGSAPGDKAAATVGDTARAAAVAVTTSARPTARPTALSAPTTSVAASDYVIEQAAATPVATATDPAAATDGGTTAPPAPETVPPAETLADPLAQALDMAGVPTPSVLPTPVPGR